MLSYYRLWTTSPLVEELKGLVTRLDLAVAIILSLLLLAFLLSELHRRFYSTSKFCDVRNLLFVLYEYNIRRVYGAQRPTTHDTLYHGVESVLRPGVSRPCILCLVAVGRGSACTALRLAYSLASVIIQLLNPSKYTQNADFTLRGRDFTSPDDDWEFFGRMMPILNRHRVAVVTEFHCLHPMAAAILAYMANETIVSQPKSVILVLIDTGERFSRDEVDRHGASYLGEVAIRECLGPFLDQRVLERVIRVLTWRTSIVGNEPSHRPSVCPVCTPRRRPVYSS